MHENIKIFKDKEEVAEVVCRQLVSISNNCQEGQQLHIALSGGSTPNIIYDKLAAEYAELVNWQPIHFWWSDERCVAWHDPESNYGQVKQRLFDQVDAIDPKQIHPVNTKLNPDQASLDYVQRIKKHVSLYQGFPRFDLVLLGMGEDGHTASLFPNDVSLDCDTWTAVATNPESSQSRVTLSYYCINNAKNIMFIITGQTKAQVVYNLFYDKHKSLRYPAHYIQPTAGDLRWYLDEQAGSLLKR